MEHAHTPLRIWTSVWLLSTLTALTACGGGGTESVTQGELTAQTLALPAPPLSPADQQLSRREWLGKRLFSDPNLSEPRGTACLSCHAPATGFASNNGSRTGTPLGSLRVTGLRNSMTNAYNAQIPAFGFQTEDGVVEAVGGHFWDGRADTLALQALGPFLNPAEMNNPNAQAVVNKIAASPYADQFRQEFGAGIFSNPTAAFNQVGEAIAAFEGSAQLQPFSSRYDDFVRGTGTLAPQETRGMALFMDTQRANCVSCHTMNPSTGNPADSPFSDFSYYATGIPRNAAITNNANPSFFDLGLCGPNRNKPALPATAPASLNADSFCGKFRMPTLRNAGLRKAFMHNGVFKNLTEVVHFYSTIKSNPERWYNGSSTPNDLPLAYLPNIESAKAPFNRSRAEGPVLTPAEINDLVAFLQTLNDR